MALTVEEGEGWREKEKRYEIEQDSTLCTSLVYLKNFDKFLMLQIRIYQIIHMLLETGQQIPVGDHMMSHDIT